MKTQINVGDSYLHLNKYIFNCKEKFTHAYDGKYGKGIILVSEEGLEAYAEDCKKI
jgi:hypothetical protein